MAVSLCATLTSESLLTAVMTNTGGGVTETATAASTRRSAAGMLPVPDSNIDSGDRRDVAGIYRGGSSSSDTSTLSATLTSESMLTATLTNTGCAA